MIGYQPSSFQPFYGNETKSKSIKTQIKRGQYPHIWTEQAWSVTDLYMAKKGTWGTFSCAGWDKRRKSRASIKIGPSGEQFKASTGFVSFVFSHTIKVCSAPKSMGFQRFLSENGSRFCPYWFKTGHGFLRENHKSV